MRTLSRERLIYATIAFGVVFASYLLTLSPTLTFWDAGEFITTAYILGIPHPPGTPLFVLIGHVFGMLPLGLSFAVKMNVMSALVSSVGCFFYFLVVASILGRVDRGMGWNLPSSLVNAGALAAVLVGAWGQSQWSNSTETEVYSVALATIALVTFLVFYWADHLEEGKDWNLLLLVVFLMGLSIGNHLMALLAMPAAVVFVVATDPLSSSVTRLKITMPRKSTAAPMRPLRMVLLRLPRFSAASRASRAARALSFLRWRLSALGTGGECTGSDNSAGIGGRRR